MLHRQPRRNWRRGNLWLLGSVLGCIGLVWLIQPVQAGVQTYPADDGRNLVNPERGLYEQFTSQAEQNPLNESALKQMREEGLSLILRMYYLKTFRDRPLSEAQLGMIDHDFSVMRRAGVKCVLRFAYSQAIGEPDAPIDIVMTHMQQLKPIVRRHADVILTAQAGFVGAWGEWHASMNDLSEPDHAKRIVDAWLDILPASRTVQLRTPRQKWMILGHDVPLTREQAFTDTPIARIGHHNDCFISSDTDVGTYENIEKEKAYLFKETRYVPMGGETCALTRFAEPDNARAELEKLHFTYLNLGYHPEVIEKWRSDGFFQEVRNRLGYRLSLVSLEVPGDATAGGELPIRMELINTGFAAPCNPRLVQLVLVHSATGETRTIPIPAEARDWLPGAPIVMETLLSLPNDMVEGMYRLYLAMPDPEPTLRDRPAYAIQLANPGLWDERTGRHDLRASLHIHDQPVQDTRSE